MISFSEGVLMKYCRCLLVALLAGVLLSAGSLALAQNKLFDPGFEGSITYDGPPFLDSWEGFSSGDPTVNPLSVFGTTMPRTGSQALELAIDNVDNAFAGVFQDVPALAGNPIEFSVWHKALAGSNGAGIEMRIEFRDSVGNTEISRTSNFTPASLGTDYELFSVNAVMPAGSDTARVVYAIQSFGGVLDQQIFVDDASVTVIPEPTSVGLMGLAGLAIATMRRRK